MLLTVKEISKAYPGEALGAVNNISFSMQAGEIISLVGKSGSGKSTLLRLIGGLIKPDQGEIFFENKPLDNPEDQLIAGHEAIKMVFQDYQLMPNMTVEDNIRYLLLAYDRRYQQERVETLLALCNLNGLGKKPLRELSGGQQQRLALARALAPEPKLLLMDEPFSHLDPIHKEKLLMEILHIVSDQAVGLVWVTHDVREAMMISDRVGFLENGHLIQLDTPDTLYKAPANLAVAEFFGHINVFGRKEFSFLFPNVGSLAYDGVFTHIGIRAEYIRCYEAKHPGSHRVKILRKIYAGSRYLVVGSIDAEKKILLFAEEEDILHTQSIWIRPEVKKLLFFDLN